MREGPVRLRRSLWDGLYGYHRFSLYPVESSKYTLGYYATPGLNGEWSIRVDSFYGVLIFVAS